MNFNTKRLVSRLCLAGLLLLLLGSNAEACPTCKLALEGGTDHSQQGYAMSILFMMSMPFLIFSGWTIFVVRSIYKQKAIDQKSRALIENPAGV